MSDSPEWTVRPYTPDDLEDILRVWTEVGWMSASATEAQRGSIGALLESGHAVVAQVNGAAEAQGHGADATFRYDSADLHAWLVTSVTVSRVARRMGIAQGVTSEVVKTGAERGAVIAFLGIFDQGFYDKLGFGSGSYEFDFVFDPASLNVGPPRSRPVRLDIGDLEDVANAMKTRKRGHGAITVTPVDFYQESLVAPDRSALGFRDDDGALTHYMSFKSEGEQGPIKVFEMAYQSTDQLFDLLGLIKSFADQVVAVHMIEPVDLILQDVLDRPHRRRALTRGSSFPARHGATGWWQMRILDLAAAMGEVSIAESIDFNLSIEDPLEIVPETVTVQLGETSSVTDGHSPELPTVRASIGAISRWWAGAGTAAKLSATDDFAAPDDLIAQLDRHYRLPVLATGMRF